MGGSAGLWFTWLDGLAIVLGAGATWIAWRFVGSAALLLPLTLGHFFLFCNVFRIRRSYEVGWALAFLVNTGVWLHRGDASWPRILAVQTPVTLGLILFEMRSPRYRGVFRDRLNASRE
jgi:hypothetical protein